MQLGAPSYIFADDFVERKNLAWRVEPGVWDGLPGDAVDGFSVDEARAFRGDDKLHVLSWKGGSAAPRDGVMLRFYLTAARLYGFELQ